MDLSTLLFSLILLSAGIWLVYNVSGEFKSKNRQAQSFADAPYRRPQVVRRNAQAARNSLERVSRPSASAMKIDAPQASTARLETLGAADQLQSLSASFVREKFERFQRDL
jgi:hypothetical protein